MKRNVFLLVLVLILSMAVFAGCGEDAGADPTSAPTNATTTAPTSAPTSTPTAEPTAEPTPVPTIAPTVVNGKYAYGYIKEGLVILYEGNYNTEDGLNAESTTWYDLSGNGNHTTDLVLGDNCKFTDKGLWVDSVRVLLTDVALDTINSEAFTVEFRVNEITIMGTNYATLVNAKNDAFALYYDVNTTNLAFKNGANARPKLGDALEYIGDTTITVTFDLDAGECYMYVDGEYVAEAEPTDLLGAESPMFLCHDSSAKKYSGYITSFRVYNRALDEDEILHNATLEQAITPVVAE